MVVKKITGDQVFSGTPVIIVEESGNIDNGNLVIGGKYIDNISLKKIATPLLKGKPIKKLRQPREKHLDVIVKGIPITKSQQQAKDIWQIKKENDYYDDQRDKIGLPGEFAIVKVLADELTRQSRPRISTQAPDISGATASRNSLIDNNFLDFTFPERARHGGHASINTVDELGADETMRFNRIRPDIFSPLSQPIIERYNTVRHRRFADSELVGPTQPRTQHRRIVDADLEIVGPTQPSTQHRRITHRERRP